MPASDIGGITFFFEQPLLKRTKVPTITESASVETIFFFMCSPVVKASDKYVP
jgi:hypothetical protein